MSALLDRPRLAPAVREERQSKRRKVYEAPGFLTYALLFAFFAGSAFPLWWSFVIGSRQSSDTNLVPPTIVPGGNFLGNAAKVFETVPFFQALINSIVISGAITVSVVFFSTLAGYSFAKLKFRASNGLLLVGAGGPEGCGRRRTARSGRRRRSRRCGVPQPPP